MTIGTATIKQGKKGISLIKGQRAILDDFHSATVAAIAGTGGGKTQLLYWWLHSRMEAYPGQTWLVVEPTYPMMSKVITTSSDLSRPSLIDYLRAVGHHPDYHSQDRIIFTDYGKVFLGSADKPDSMQGAAVKGAALDEAGQMRLLAYETARQRVAMQDGQVLITTTPYDLGWLKTEVNDRNGTLGIHVEKWRSIDRPGFPRKRYELDKQTLPPWRFRMLYDAEFERPAGFIYSSFNEAVCVIDRLPKEKMKDWLVYVGHDFGPDNPAAVFFAVDPTTGQIYLFAEYLPGPGVSVHDRVEAFKKITEGMTVVMRCGGSVAEEEARQAYNAHGWVITAPKITHVEPRIEKVFAMHSLNKIMVFRDCTHYLDEKRSFSRELDEVNRPTAKIKNESKFHLMSSEQCILSQFTPETARRRTSRTYRY